MLRAAIASVLLATASPLLLAQATHVMVVAEEVTIRVNPDSTSTTDRTDVLKALDAVGARCLSSYSIPYQGARQSVTVDASVVLPDQTELKASPSDIVDSPLTQEPEYLDARHVQVTLPGVVSGAVVRVHTRRVERQPFLPGVFSFFDIAPRQWPVEEVSYDITAPAALHLRVQANNLKGAQHRLGDQDHWTFSAAKIPPLVNVASASEMLKKSPFLAVSGSSNTDRLATQYLARVLPSQHISLELQYIADSVGKGSIDPDVLIRRYYEWINDQVRLVDLPLEMGRIKPRRADEVVVSGYGTAEDRVIVLQALMRAKAQYADLVLVPSLPVTWGLAIPTNMAFSNRVLLTAHNGQEVLDIGNPVVALGEAGPRDRGKQGIRITPEGFSSPLPIPETHSAHDASTAVSTAMMVQKDGSITGESIVTDYGDLAADAREAAFDGAAALKRKIGGRTPKGMTLAINHSDNPRQPNNAFTITASFSTPKKFVDPKGGFVMPFPRPVTSVSPLEDFALSSGGGLCQKAWKEERTEIRLAVPHPFIPPKNVDVTAAESAGHYTAVYSQEDGKLVATRTLELNVDPSTCSHDQQAELSRLAKSVREDLNAELNVLR